MYGKPNSGLIKHMPDGEVRPVSKLRSTLIPRLSKIKFALSDDVTLSRDYLSPM